MLCCVSPLTYGMDEITVEIYTQSLRFSLSIKKELNENEKIKIHLFLEMCGYSRLPFSFIIKIVLASGLEFSSLSSAEDMEFF